MRDKKVLFMAQAAMIAALYVALTYVFAPISFSEVQVRIAEALTILPVFTPAAIPGLFIGCLLGNIMGGALVPDILLGSLATLIGAFFYLEAAESKPVSCTGAADCRQHADCAVCAEICLRCGSADSVYDADGWCRRGAVLRSAGNAAVFCTEEEQRKDFSDCM